MATSDSVKALLCLSEKKQYELAEAFGMSKQAMSNKFSKNSWFAKDLIKVAELCNCKVAFILPNGQNITIE